MNVKIVQGVNNYNGNDITQGDLFCSS